MKDLEENLDGYDYNLKFRAFKTGQKHTENYQKFKYITSLHFYQWKKCHN